MREMGNDMERSKDKKGTPLGVLLQREKEAARKARRKPQSNNLCDWLGVPRNAQLYINKSEKLPSISLGDLLGVPKNDDR